GRCWFGPVRSAEDLTRCRRRAQSFEKDARCPPRSGAHHLRSIRDSEESMQRLPFTEEQEMFRQSAREFFKREVQPHTERWREAGIVDREAFRKAGDAGLLLIWADEKYGGLGLRDFRYEQILIEENAWHGDPC